MTDLIRQHGDVNKTLSLEMRRLLPAKQEGLRLNDRNWISEQEMVEEG